MKKVYTSVSSEESQQIPSNFDEIFTPSEDTLSFLKDFAHTYYDSISLVSETTPIVLN
ncbi:MAG: hypothetical protein WCQ82_00155 [Bacteroidaceae bacterium]|nr:hypothetical protein [Bacteroidaceae bacterium]